MIYDHFRATGAHDAALDLSRIFNVSLQGDDIEDFDTWWDQALLSASQVPVENALDSLYESLFSFRLYWHCTTKKLSEIERCQAVKD